MLVTRSISPIANALTRALPLFFRGRVLAIAIVPVLLAFVVWIALLVAAWGPLAHALGEMLGVNEGVEGALISLGTRLFAFGLLTVGVALVALVAIATLSGGVFVRVVADQYFPGLERKHGGTFVGGAANAAGAVGTWLVLAILALPLWFVPPLAFVALMVLNAWLNQRLFRYDALAGHASCEEREAVLRAARWRLLGLGLVLAPFGWVPIVNLLLPFYAGLAFTCLCLAELERLRSTRLKLAGFGG